MKRKRAATDTPRKFTEILGWKTREKPVKQPKKQTKLPTIRENESIKAFSRRIDDECRTLINKAHTKDSKSSKKKLEYFKTKKLKSKKIDSNNDDDGCSNVYFEKTGKDGDGGLIEKIPFGLQAMEPPSLTFKPRGSKNLSAQSQRRNTLQSTKKLEIPKVSTTTNETKSSVIQNDELSKKEKKDPAVCRKIKLKKLSPSERMRILKEREKAIEIYRNLKTKRSVDGNNSFEKLFVRGETID